MPSGYGGFDADRSYEWNGAFVGVDWVRNEFWTHSVRYNFADAGDLADTNTLFEGIDISSLTFSSSYYFMRNVKGVLELNVDLLSKDEQTGQFFYRASEPRALRTDRNRRGVLKAPTGRAQRRRRSHHAWCPRRRGRQRR